MLVCGTEGQTSSSSEDESFSDISLDTLLTAQALDCLFLALGLGFNFHAFNALNNLPSVSHVASPILNPKTQTRNPKPET